ncbi:hypothetical protein [Paraburkholderia sp. SIMBA_030]
MAQAGPRIESRDGNPAWVQFWDEVGAYPSGPSQFVGMVGLRHAF